MHCVSSFREILLRPHFDFQRNTVPTLFRIFFLSGEIPKHLILLLTKLNMGTGAELGPVNFSW